MQQEKQFEAATLEQRVRELQISHALPYCTPDEDLRSFSDSSLEPLGELREALLLCGLARHAGGQKRSDYIRREFLPYLERQPQELRALAQVRLLQAIALRESGQPEQALGIAEKLPTDSAENGDGYALWGALLLDAGELAEAERVLDAGVTFYAANPWLQYEPQAAWQ